MDTQDETMPLLASEESRKPQTPPRASPTTFSHLWQWCNSLPTIVRVTPIIFLSAMSDGLPQSAIVDIMKSVLCSVWYLKDSLGEIPDDGSIPNEKCQTPGPVAWFSAFMVTQTLLMALGGFLMSSAIAQCGTRVGRKPVLVLIVLGQFVAISSFMAALFMPSDVGALILLGVWLVTSSFFSTLPLVFTCNLMAGDTTGPSDRTAARSFTMGAMAAGGIPSFALGGFIYRVAGSRVLTSTFTFLLPSSGFVRERFDILGLIFAHYAKKETIVAPLETLLLVCRAWKDAALGHRTLWTDMRIYLGHQPTSQQWTTRLPLQLARCGATSMLDIAIRNFLAETDIEERFPIGLDEALFSSAPCVASPDRFRRGDCPCYSAARTCAELSLQILAGRNGEHCARWKTLVLDFGHRDDSGPQPLGRHSAIALSHSTPSLTSLVLKNIHFCREDVGLE